MDSTEQKNAPAYVPFDTLEAFIATLKKVTVPDTIHKTLMPNLSGGTQSHLLSALRFLDLIKQNGQPQPSLHTLVAAYGTSEWQAEFGRLIDKVYKPIIGDLNVKTAIGKSLRGKFKDASGLDGETLDRSIRFYIKALKASGTEISPYLKARKAGNNGKRASSNGKPVAPAQPKTASAQSKPQTPTGNDEVVPTGMVTMPLFPPPRRFMIPQDITEAECETVSAMALAYARSANQAKKEQ